MTRQKAPLGQTAPPRPPARVVVENVQPRVDDGRFPVKRTVGERVLVTADIHTDGHDEVAALLLHRAASVPDWSETPLEPQGNDLWRSEFTVTSLEPQLYTVEAWIEPFRTWRRGLLRKSEGQNVEPVDLLIGAGLVEEASKRARGEDQRTLTALATGLRELAADPTRGVPAALEPRLRALMNRYPDRTNAARYDKELLVSVDRERARFSAWYEMFPRSCAAEAGRHGTLRDCEERLPYVASMGFDVLYLPPIHPIGRTKRKGPNNDSQGGPDAHGSPWAIGAAEGGHKAVHPELGTLADFRRLLEKARTLGLEVALDLAFQCAPDHPYVTEHPEWFRMRPDGRVQFAENPPKKYEDIYPFDFDSPAWKELWQELKSVVLFWVEQGVRIFRVDNPHTKPFPFWEWLIGETRKDHPELLFLSEAFTRPKVMHRLAKLGFTQSYTYFAWRNTKSELTEYATELALGPGQEYLRPNLWPNTPDILPEPLQFGGRTAFQGRLVLAATLSGSYGIYGPAFELCEGRARAAGTEDYLDSEKYELRTWDIGRADSLQDFIARVNHIRRENPALHRTQGIAFHPIDNEQLIAYSKATDDLSNVVLVVVGLDPHHVHSGWLELPLESLGLEAGQPYQVHDLLTDARYLWNGPRNYVEIDPKVAPAHIFRLRRKLRTERDFDYFL